MYASGRARRRLREAASLPGQAHAAAANDQQAGGNGRKTLQLRVPHPPSPVPQYYPGTSIPMNGWFHACKLCRCWTAFCAFDADGQGAPLCRRCATHHHKDIRLVGAFDSDTAVGHSGVACHTATGQLLAPAVAPASLDDDECQSATAYFTASFLSAECDMPIHHEGSTTAQQPHMHQYVSNHQCMAGQPAAADTDWINSSLACDSMQD